MSSNNQSQGAFGNDPISADMQEALYRARLAESNPMYIRCLEPPISLRDRFAMAAMQGDWTRANGTWANNPVGSDGDLKSARVYYAMADAMLKAREVKP